MKVFISWSGVRSGKIALLFAEFLKTVVPPLMPWISKENIEKGSLWFGDITTELEEVTMGVVFLTSENKESPWILFEAGALYRGLTKQKVCTVLVDLEFSDVKDPLAAFNHSKLEKTEIFKLCKSVNNGLGQGRVDENVIKKYFDAFWPDFEDESNKVIAATPSVTREVRSESSKIDEILEKVRALESRPIHPSNAVLNRMIQPGEIAFTALSRMERNDETLGLNAYEEAFAEALTQASRGFGKAAVRRHIREKYNEQFAALVTNRIFETPSNPRVRVESPTRDDSSGEG